MDCALMSLQKSFCPTLNPEDFFFQKDLQFQILHLDVWSTLQFSSNFCIRCEIQAKIQLFAQEYPIVPKSLAHKTIISPLNSHCTFAKKIRFPHFLISLLGMNSSIILLMIFLLSLFIELFVLYWNIATQQCCDSFRWIAEGLYTFNTVAPIVYFFIFYI